MNTNIPGFPDLIATYPMVQVMMSRWGYHKPGTWQIQLHCEGVGFFTRCAVVDEFGSLVPIESQS